jgi:hypothetical protein
MWDFLIPRLSVTLASNIVIGAVMDQRVTDRKNPATERQRRWRANGKAGEAVSPVRWGGSVANGLCRYGWLAERDCADRKKVGDAITRLLRDMAKET